MADWATGPGELDQEEYDYYQAPKAYVIMSKHPFY